jgi:hypothetical protein
MSTWTGGGLTMPDLRSHFRHLHWRVMPQSFGVEVASDWADKSADDPIFGQFKNCGLWTMGEAAILFNVAKEISGQWLDVGSHTGWTTRHLMAAGLHPVHMIEPMYAVPEFLQRMYSSTQAFTNVPLPMYSDDFWESFAGFGLNGDGSRAFSNTFTGVCIDGCHEDGQPQRDAANAAKHLADTGVIIFHDGVGRPVREAAQYLMSIGFKCRAYFTPYLVLCCWRGDFTPPDHEPDPVVKAAHLDGRYPDFRFDLCE